MKNKKYLWSLLALCIAIVMGLGLASCDDDDDENNHEETEQTIGKLSCPDGKHPHVIDLGLPSGTKWACCNVGATKPEDFGGYYAWGETEENTTYSWNTYIHCDGSEQTCHHLGSDIAGTEYDVAYMKWDGSWVMPSYDQLNELLDNCTSTWTTLNGVHGRFFTGTNGSSIFLPASGCHYDSNLFGADLCGCYWTSTQSPLNSNLTYYLYFYPGYATIGYYLRFSGLSVRPVVRK